MRNPFTFMFCCFCTTKVPKRSSSSEPPAQRREPVFEQVVRDTNPIDVQPHVIYPIKWEDTVPFTFPITGGQVIKVYDADTITIASKLPYDTSPLYRLSVRLNGIDAPEIKGKGISEEEKTAAKQARDFLANIILNKYVDLKNIQTEKYGRILADVYFEDLHLNELLLRTRHAVKYDGGTKIKPTSWLKYKETGDLN